MEGHAVFGSGNLTSEVVTANVVHLGVLNKAPDLGLLQVVEVIVVGSTEISAQASVVASNDNTATPSLLLGVNTILDAEASGLDSIVHDGRVLVVTSTTEIHDAVGRQDILGATGRVLGGTSSNQLGIVVVEKVLIQGKVLFLSEDGVIGLEAILFEKGLVANGLNICNRGN
jgi:hypothetical protein